MNYTKTAEVLRDKWIAREQKAVNAMQAYLLHPTESGIGKHNFDSATQVAYLEVRKELEEAFGIERSQDPRPCN